MSSTSGEQADEVAMEAALCQKGDVNEHSVLSRPGRSTIEDVEATPTLTEKSSSTMKLAIWNEVLLFFEDQWFLVALGVLIAIASQAQVPAANQQIKETLVTYLAVSVIFFVTGCTLDTKTLLQNYSRWKAHLFVQVQCFLMTSAITFGVVTAVATNPHWMDPALLVGLILMGSTATTISSNVVMTRQAHGNQAMTVVQSTVGNFIGVFVTPALIVMYTSTGAWYDTVLTPSNGHWGDIYRRVLKQLGLSIFVPLFVGQVLRNLYPKETRKVFVDWKLSKLGSICLLSILWQTYDGAFASHAFTTVPGSNMVFIIVISLAFFVVFWLIAFFTSILWLDKKDTVSVCYCVPAKTPAMGVPLSHAMFVGLSVQTESKIQIPMVIYQGLQIVIGSLLTVAFRKWVDRDEDKRDEEKAAGDNLDTAAPCVTHAG